MKKVPFDFCGSYTTTIHVGEHELFLSFKSDSGAEAFSEWLNDCGQKQFVEWCEKSKMYKDEVEEE